MAKEKQTNKNAIYSHTPQLLAPPTQRSGVVKVLGTYQPTRCQRTIINYYLPIIIIIIIIIIINLIYIAQFDTNGILTALYIVITYIQMQYVHV